MLLWCSISVSRITSPDLRFAAPQVAATEVNNRLGLNCFACHVKAKPEFDFVCEIDHGCDPIPVTRAMFGALQRTDPRCKGADQVSAADAESLKLLGEIIKALTEKK